MMTNINLNEICQLPQICPNTEKEWASFFEINYPPETPPISLWETGKVSCNKMFKKILLVLWENINARRSPEI